MSEYLTITDKGRKLIRSKFGIPYGLFLAIFWLWVRSLKENPLWFLLGAGSALLIFWKMGWL